MKKILALDIGYGHNKATFGYSDGTIKKRFKFPSMIGITKKNEYVEDSRIYDFKGHSYYVGDNASHLPSENLIDIADYKNLEHYAPLFLHHAIKEIGETPDIIVVGLSISQIGNSGYFQAELKKFTVDNKEYNFDLVYVLPQGAGSKLTIDKYGDNFPNEQKEDLSSATYIGCDIGFNTLDLFLVTEGKTSPNLFEGIEKQGVMLIAQKVAKLIHQNHNRTITLQEARDVIDSGVYKLRGKSYPYKDQLDEIKKEYLKDMIKLIEARYGKIIDKCNFISVSGGGSTIFKSTEDGFFKIPRNANEYYNSLGFFLYGVKQAEKILKS
jgi:hypothetical protein